MVYGSTEGHGGNNTVNWIASSSTTEYSGATAAAEPESHARAQEHWHDRAYEHEDTHGHGYVHEDTGAWRSPYAATICLCAHSVSLVVPRLHSIEQRKASGLCVLLYGTRGGSAPAVRVPSASQWSGVRQCPPVSLQWQADGKVWSCRVTSEA